MLTAQTFRTVRDFTHTTPWFLCPTAEGSDIEARCPPSAGACTRSSAPVAGLHEGASKDRGLP